MSQMKRESYAGEGIRANGQSRSNKAAMLCITIVVCILLCMLLVEGRDLKTKIAKNDEKCTQLEQEIAEEDQRTTDIADMQESMQSDEYIEKIAKEKFGLVRDNEIIFKESE